jgi:hypothetical protein
MVVIGLFCTFGGFILMVRGSGLLGSGDAVKFLGVEMPIRGVGPGAILEVVGVALVVLGGTWSFGGNGGVWAEAAAPGAAGESRREHASPYGYEEQTRGQQPSPVAPPSNPSPASSNRSAPSPPPGAPPVNQSAARRAPGSGATSAEALAPLVKGSPPAAAGNGAEGGAAKGETVGPIAPPATASRAAPAHGPPGKK